MEAVITSVYGRLTCALEMEVYEGPFDPLGRRHGGLAVLDRWEGAASTSAGRGWPCGPGEGPAMPSMPSMVGSAPSSAHGGDDADNVNDRGPCHEGPMAEDAASSARRLGVLVLDRWEGVAALLS